MFFRQETQCRQLTELIYMFVCQWLESYLSEGTVRRPVWGPGNLTGGSEPKWGRAGSGRKVPPVNKDVKENNQIMACLFIQTQPDLVLGAYKGARPRLKTCYPEEKQSILVNKQESSWKGQTPGFIAGEERRRKAQNHMFYVGN